MSSIITGKRKRGYIRAGPYGGENKEGGGVEGILWVSRLKSARDGKSDIKGDISGNGHETCREKVEGLSTC
jgi:hypothetical protein